MLWQGDVEELLMKAFEQAIASYAEAQEAGRIEEARGAAFEAFRLAAEEAERHPTPSLRLQLEAGACEDGRDWAGAEAAYRAVLRLEEEAGKPMPLALAHLHLSKLLRLVGRLEEAGQSAAAGSACGRAGEGFVVLAMALENEIACALDRGDTAAALLAGREIVQAIEPGKLYSLIRGRAMIALARCLVAAADVAGAESRLAEGWEWLEGVDRSLPGPIAALAAWWEVKSAVLEQQGHLEKAREAMSESIDYRRYRGEPYGIFALMRGLEKSAELAGRAGERAQAERAMAEALALREELRFPGAR